MGKRKESSNNLDFDDDQTNAAINDIEYDLDDDAFFEQFQSKTKRSNRRNKRNARRKIEEYWENRELADRLNDYYYLSDD